MVKIGSSGPFRNTERAPDLSMREAFHVVQDDHRALPVGEVRERLLEPLAQLTRLRGIAEGSATFSGSSSASRTFRRRTRSSAAFAMIR